MVNNPPVIFSKICTFFFCADFHNATVHNGYSKVLYSHATRMPSIVSCDMLFLLRYLT